MDATTKRCAGCGASKPPAEYSRDPQKRDGLSSRCKDCRRADYATRYGARARASAKRYRDANPEKVRAAQQRWYTANQERVRADQRRYREENAAELRAKKLAEYHRDPDRAKDRRLRRQFGITLAQYDALLLAQGGRCALCRTSDPRGQGRQFHVDHDHATKQVRGLLCHHCNTALGLLRDSPTLVQRALAYLRRHAPRLL